MHVESPITLPPNIPNHHHHHSIRFSSVALLIVCILERDTNTIRKVSLSLSLSPFSHRINFNISYARSSFDKRRYDPHRQEYYRDTPGLIWFHVPAVVVSKY